MITSRKVAYKLRVNNHSSIILHLWNGSFEYNGILRIESIVKWIKDLMKSKNGSLIEWLTLSGRKSKQLSEILKTGPSLILFTPRSLVLGISPYFEIVRIYLLLF